MAKELRRILGTGAKSIFQIDVTGAEEWHARTAELRDTKLELDQTLWRSK